MREKYRKDQDVSMEMTKIYQWSWNRYSRIRLDTRRELVAISTSEFCDTSICWIYLRSFDLLACSSWSPHATHGRWVFPLRDVWIQGKGTQLSHLRGMTKYRCDTAVGDISRCREWVSTLADLWRNSPSDGWYPWSNHGRENRESSIRVREEIFCSVEILVNKLRIRIVFP